MDELPARVRDLDTAVAAVLVGAKPLRTTHGHGLRAQRFNLKPMLEVRCDECRREPSGKDSARVLARVFQTPTKGRVYITTLAQPGPQFGRDEAFLLDRPWPEAMTDYVLESWDQRVHS